jgi:O-antigen/teichoic acid export membrane protein
MNVVSNALWNALRAAHGLAFGLATSIVVARALGADAYGAYSYLNWLATTGAALLGLGLPIALMKFASEAHGTCGLTVRGLLQAALVRAGAASVAGAAILFTMSAVWPVPFQRLHLALTAVTIVPTVLAACYAAAVNGLQLYGPTTRISIAVAALQFVLSAAVLAAGGGIGALLSVGLTGTVVSVFWLRGLSRRLLGRGSQTAPLEPRRRMERYAWTIVPIVLLDAIVWKRSEVFFLQRFWGMRTVALYSIAFGTGEKAMRLPHSLFGVLFPAFSGLAAARDAEAIARLLQTGTRLLAVVVVPLGFTMAVLARPLLDVLYGADYAGAAGALTVIALVNVVGATTGVGVMALYGTGDQKIVLMKDGIAAAVNLALNLTATAWWGLEGAVLANSAAQVVGSAIVWVRLAARFDLAPLVRGLPRVVAAGALAAGAARVLVVSLPAGPGLLTACLSAAVVYGASAIAIRAVSIEDRRMLRGGSA